MIDGVKASLIQALSSRRREIRQRWDMLLRLERTETPLANPDVLVHMIDWTLDKIFDELRARKACTCGEPTSSVAALRAGCQCGKNPFLGHFLAGEQAVLEALVLTQSGDATIDPAHRGNAVAELYLAINAIARGEIESLCSLCKNRLRSKRQSRTALNHVEIGGEPSKWQRDADVRGTSRATHPQAGGRHD
jgi:hypothetical protein